MALISPQNVERKYGVSTADLARWRQAGQGPQYYRISARLVRYGTDDLEKWFRDPANAHLHDLPVNKSDNLCSA
jgi:predicted DNA-binding transcriptional regulator AlpA